MAKLIRLNTVTRDGFHNAFTDMQFWNGCFWISYRKGATHISLDSQAIIACSADKCRFYEAAKIKIAGDVRDPKMVVVGPDRMALLVCVVPYGYEAEQLQQYICFSKDGVNFDEPKSILPPNHWLWRVVPFNGKYYGACYLDLPKKDPAAGGLHVRTQLMVSDDLLKWEKVSQIGQDDMALCETGMYFTQSQELWTVTRRNNESFAALLAIAKPPYTDWEYHHLNTSIEAPIIFEQGGVLYVSGRSHNVRDGRMDHPHAEPEGLAIWRLERGKVTSVLRLPAAGDCSYPGIAKDPSGRLFISYYSQHAYMDGVLPLPLYPEEIRVDHRGALLKPADIYFGEISLA
jgi:hypothetical protein